jgi:sugar-specific transcriptional regulator TrmB
MLKKATISMEEKEEYLVLQDFGLTESESKVYLTLLRVRSGLAGDITKKTGMHRRNVYDALERLVQKGLVGFIIQNKRKYFQVKEPERFLEILENKKIAFEKILPKLESRYESAETKQEVMILKGKNGLKTAFDDQIKVGKPIYVYGASEKYNSILKYYSYQHRRKRLEKKINVKIIFNENVKGTERAKMPLAEVKFLPEEFIGVTDTIIYGNKVELFIWTEDPFVIMIESKELADSYRKFFNLLWKTAKK